MAYIPRKSKTSPVDMTWIGNGSGITDDNKYWYSNDYNAGATNDLCLPNCTTYAMGRSGEIAGKSCRNYEILNRTGFGNAATWWSNALWEKTQTPKLGAIACWTDNGKGWGGHVAIVEETDGTLAGTKLSMSGYVAATTGGRTFNNPGESANWYFQYLDFETTNYYFTTYNNRGGTFQGFLINPYASDTPTPPTPGGDLVVTLIADPSSGGTCAGGGTYEYGQEATFIATPNTGWEFVKWSDGYTNPLRYWTITESFTLTAFFKKKVEPRNDISLENSITVKALKVLKGDYGTGIIRKRKLGSLYNDVQYQVNYLINKYSLYERLALQVLAGLWGNGRTRKRLLQNKGYNYYLVQQKVAEMENKVL